jgi:hypothetical protein
MSRRGQSVDFLGADPLNTAERLEALAADLRRLAADRMPSAGDLAEAPVLRGWGVLSRPSTALTGTVEGHPRIGDHRQAVTSELFAIDRDARWARTLNRYYRLLPRRAGRTASE